MELFSYLEAEMIQGEHSVISITGGGGKTTLMISFGEYLKNKGYSVLLTTTTKVANPKNVDYKTDFIFSDESAVIAHDVKKSESVFYAERSIDVKKWQSPRLEVLSYLTKCYDVVLIEADGSRGLPLKIHTERDPVIIKESTGVIGVLGAKALNRKAYEVVFGDGSERVVDKAYLEDYLKNDEGIRKGMRDECNNVIILNSADELAKEEIDSINSWNLPIKLASIKKDMIYV